MKWKYSWTFLLVDALLFGIAAIGQGLISIGIVNLVVIPIIIIFTAFSWRGKENGDNNNIIETKN